MNAYRVSGPMGTKTFIFWNIWPLARPNVAKEGPGDLGCLKLIREQAAIGLRREFVDFLDIRKVETLILVILDLH